MATAFRPATRVQASTPRELTSLPRGSRSPQKSDRRPPGLPVPPHSVVRRLPAPKRMPRWLLLLIRLQRSSTVLALILVVATLIVYSSTVYTQQLWSKEYRRLKDDQRSERQLVSTSEALKNQLSQQAERPSSGLIPKTPSSMLLVQPAPPRSASLPAVVTPKPESMIVAPLGY